MATPNASSLLGIDLTGKITPEDQTRLKNALADAVGIVTQQGRDELARFVNTYTPALAVYGPLAAAGNKEAQQTLAHLRAQIVTDAALYGVKVLQSQEKAFMVAVDVFTKVAVSAILPAVAAA